MYQLPVKPKHCELCQRPCTVLTKHHLIPKSLHRKHRIKKTFSKNQCITHIAWLCHPCHKMIHRFISEKDMAAHYYEVALLVQEPNVVEFVNWIKDKPIDFKPKY